MMNDDYTITTTTTMTTTSMENSAAGDDANQRQVEQQEATTPCCGADTTSSVSAPGTAPPSPEDMQAANTYMDVCDMVTDDCGAAILSCFSAPSLGSYDGTQGLSLFNDEVCGPDWETLDVELCGL